MINFPEITSLRYCSYAEYEITEIPMITTAHKSTIKAPQIKSTMPHASELLTSRKCGLMYEASKMVLSGTKGEEYMTCYIWFERVVCADYDYIRNISIRLIHYVII